MRRNQFIHHYTMHQNNILRAKVEASGIKPKHLSSQGKCSGIFKSKKDGSQRLYASTRNGESLMAQSFLIQIWDLRLGAQRKVLMVTCPSVLLRYSM